MLNSKKRGRFRLNSEFVMSQPERIAEVFAMIEFVPVKVESLIIEAEIEYIGMAKIFEEIEQGERTPEYRLLITKSSSGNVELVEYEKI